MGEGGYSISSSNLISGQWNWRGALQSPRPQPLEGGPQRRTQDEAMRHRNASAGLPVMLSYRAYCKAGGEFPPMGYAFEATICFREMTSESRSLQLLTSLPSSTTAMLLSVKFQSLTEILGSGTSPVRAECGSASLSCL